MSRKLQSQIQDIKGMPGRVKRILLAWASFANNDGTNIFPAKESVAERAGVSRWTVYDNSDILEAADVLQRAGSHVCRNERCNKGGTHWTSRHGHYTAVYKINVALLGNPTLLLQRIKEALVAKSNSGTVGKTKVDTVGKPDTTQVLKETPAALGIAEDSYALTSGVSESVSEADSEASPPPSIAEEQEKPAELTSEERRLLCELLPVHGLGLESSRSVKATLQEILLLADAAGVDAIDLLRYNRAHKKGGLHVRTPEAFLKALNGAEDGTYALINEYIEHDPSACKACKELSQNRKVKGHAQCKLVREAARVLAEKKAWVDVNNGKWDFSSVSGLKGSDGSSAADPVFQRFVDIVNPIANGKRGKWAREGFNVGAKLLAEGSEAQVLSAAIRHVVKTGKHVTFEEFMGLHNEAVQWVDWHHEVYGQGKKPE